MHVLLALLLCFPTGEPKTTSFKSLVAAERAFDARCAQIGVRASFVEFFSDSAIAFNPAPYYFKAWAKSAPPPSNSLVKLHWEPTLAGVSRAGDLGFTTGPYSVSVGSPDTARPSYGMFFTLWKKQADGAWKVALDCGNDMPQVINGLLGMPCREVPMEFGGSSTAKSLQLDAEEIQAIDRELAVAVRDGKSTAAFARHTSGDLRVHYEGGVPLVGKEACRAREDKVIEPGEYVPLRAFVARSGDMGYTYGAYEMAKGSGEKGKGYYCHLWKKSQRGQWKLSIEIMKTAAP